MLRPGVVGGTADENDRRSPRDRSARRGRPRPTLFSRDGPPIVGSAQPPGCPSICRLPLGRSRLGLGDRRGRLGLAVGGAPGPTRLGAEDAPDRVALERALLQAFQVETDRTAVGATRPRRDGRSSRLPNRRRSIRWASRRDRVHRFLARRSPRGGPDLLFWCPDLDATRRVRRPGTIRGLAASPVVAPRDRRDARRRDRETRARTSESGSILLRASPVRTSARVASQKRRGRTRHAARRERCSVEHSFSVATKQISTSDSPSRISTGRPRLE